MIIESSIERNQQETEEVEDVGGIDDYDMDEDQDQHSLSQSTSQRTRGDATQPEDEAHMVRTCHSFIHSFTFI